MGVPLVFLTRTYVQILWRWINPFFFWPCRMAWGILVPWPGLEPGPWRWKRRVLTPGPPGNSQNIKYYSKYIQKFEKDLEKSPSSSHTPSNSMILHQRIVKYLQKGGSPMPIRFLTSFYHLFSLHVKNITCLWGLSGAFLQNCSQWFYDLTFTKMNPRIEYMWDYGD